MKKGMPREQAESRAKQEPPRQNNAPTAHTQKKEGAAAGAAPAGHKDHGKDKNKDKDKDKEKDKGKEGGKKEERTRLPSEIVQKFKKDTDLSNVPVVKNSRRAQEKHVQGFATHDEIHLAPGADESKVLMHEAAHVVQFRKGAAGHKHEDEKTNESKAQAAEGGAGGDPGAADPGAVRHSNTPPAAGAAPASEHGGETSATAQADFTWADGGVHFQGISGAFTKELISAHWPEMQLFHVNTFWPIPCLPVAGLAVGAEGVFAPEAKVTANATWAYTANDHKITIGGSLKGEITAALIARIRAGIALNAVIVEGGVGLEAAASLNVHAEATQSLNFWINVETGEVGFTDTPLEVALGADINAALSLVAWIDGFWGEDVKRWTFANYRVATLANWKLPIAFTMSSGHPAIGGVGPVEAGGFTWGSPPEPAG